MELRVLQYFLAVTREQSITAAAEALHLSQPTLSRQLKELEQELGHQLMIRGKRQITLTEEGMILRRRAEEILELVGRAQNEISCSNETIAGDITVGAGETEAMRALAQAVHQLRQQHPLIRLHVFSGDRITVTEQLDNGLIDFGLMFGEVDAAKYESITIPHRDSWGVFMLRSSPLAEKEELCAQDLRELPLIISRRMLKNPEMREFFDNDYERLNIIATFNLLYNGSLMVEEGLGYAIGLEGLINVSGDSRLCFRPLTPRVETSPHLVWKKYRVHNRATTQFIHTLTDMLEAQQ